MTTELISTGPRKPTWGIISVCCPFSGLLLGLAALFGTSGKEAAGFVFCVLIIFFALFLGAISVMVALARAEKFWPFTFLGMVFNGIPLVLFLIKYVP